MIEWLLVAAAGLGIVAGFVIGFGVAWHKAKATYAPYLAEVRELRATLAALMAQGELDMQRRRPLTRYRP